MSSCLGNKIKIQIFGESHSRAIGVVIDGLPSGFKPDMTKVSMFMKRRAPGQNELATNRNEEDIPEILSGIYNGITCGTPLCAVIYNSDCQSKDYNNLQTVPRPSHADYPMFIKTQGNNDIRGGGHSSGRLTAPLCFAGAIFLQILEKHGVRIGARIASIATVSDDDGNSEAVLTASKKNFPVINDTTGTRMRNEIIAAKSAGDSVGGIIECVITGMAPGIGEPIFDGIENRISAAVFGVPGVKGIEFGAGFAATKMKGSENNDSYFIQDGKVRMRTNNHGGILGGMTSGAPIIFRVAIKPTPSISLPQQSVDLETKQDTTLVIHGRHDPCIVPRAVPAIEAAAAISILDILASETAL